MKLRMSIWGVTVADSHAREIETLVTRALERVDARRQLRRVSVLLDADPAPPWFRCRLKLRFEDGGKVVVDATATQLMTAVSCALDHLDRASIDDREVGRWWLGWLTA
ncbi:MAG: hypothetical protein KC503_19375 [Myxococcales bacterium]|nr:hypothetical protein [Myxococcales bacterium]